MQQYILAPTPALQAAATVTGGMYVASSGLQVATIPADGTFGLYAAIFHWGNTANTAELFKTDHI